MLQVLFEKRRWQRKTGVGGGFVLEMLPEEAMRKIESC